MVPFRRIVAFVIVIAGPATALGTTTVRLHPTARVPQAVVRLGDVATVHDTDAERVNRLAAIEIGALSATGDKSSIDVPAIKERLRQAGISLATVELGGAYVVKVVRVPGSRSITAPLAKEVGTTNDATVPTDAAGSAAEGKILAAARVREGTEPPVLIGSGPEPRTVEADRAGAKSDKFADPVESASGGSSLALPDPTFGRTFEGPTDLAERASWDPPKAGSTEWQSVILAMLRPHVAAGLGIAEDALQLEVEADRAVEFLNQHRPATWDLVTPSAWRLGAQQVNFEAPAGDQKVRIPLRVTVAAAQSTVVARRRIAQGSTIGPDDVQLVHLFVRADDPNEIRSVAEVVGKQAERAIAQDRPLCRRDVRNPPVVFRNSPVTVHVRHRTAYFTMQATARDDGAIGEWITVVNPTNRQPLEVRVTGFQTAELVAAGVAERGTKTNDRPSPAVSIAGKLSGAVP
jgi:flagella basal body P-ring formation protein FlgA